MFYLSKSSQKADFRYKITVIPLYQNDGYSLAEKEGFEPSKRFPVYMISNHAPSTGLGDFSINMYLLKQLLYYITQIWICQQFFAKFAKFL